MLDSQGHDGISYLSVDEYTKQITDCNRGWRCLTCGVYPCEFDDDYFDLPLSEETPSRDWVAHPLTDVEKAALSIASFDMALYDLRRAAKAVLSSRRKVSGTQNAVLTNLLDDLEQEVQKPAPKWPVSS